MTEFPSELSSILWQMHSFEVHLLWTCSIIISSLYNFLSIPFRTSATPQVENPFPFRPITNLHNFLEIICFRYYAYILGQGLN